MSALKETFGKLHGAMLTGDSAPVISSVRPNLKISSERQVAIYVDGYRIRLLQAIRSDYPALAELLGEAFDPLALAYIESQPPAHFNLDRYPHGFAGFVRNRQQDALAADLATLEGAIAEVFMLEESAPLVPEQMVGMAPEAFARLVLKARTASRLLTLYYPADAYLAAQREGHAPRRQEPKKTYLFLVRHQHEVKRHNLARAEYTLLARLYEGLPVGPALEAAMAHEAGQAEMMASSLQRWFAHWVGNGFFRKEGA